MIIIIYLSLTLIPALCRDLRRAYQIKKEAKSAPASDRWIYGIILK